MILKLYYFCALRFWSFQCLSHSNRIKLKLLRIPTSDLLLFWGHKRDSCRREGKGRLRPNPWQLREKTRERRKWQLISKANSREYLNLVWTELNIPKGLINTFKSESSPQGTTGSQSWGSGIWRGWGEDPKEQHQSSAMKGQWAMRTQTNGQLGNLVTMVGRLRSCHSRRNSQKAMRQKQTLKQKTEHRGITGISRPLIP